MRSPRIETSLGVAGVVYPNVEELTTDLLMRAFFAGESLGESIELFNRTAAFLDAVQKAVQERPLTEEQVRFSGDDQRKELHELAIRSSSSYTDITIARHPFGVALVGQGSLGRSAGDPEVLYNRLTAHYEFPGEAESMELPIRAIYTRAAEAAGRLGMGKADEIAEHWKTLEIPIMGYEEPCGDPPTTIIEVNYDRPATPSHGISYPAERALARVAVGRRFMRRFDSSRKEAPGQIVDGLVRKSVSYKVHPLHCVDADKGTVTYGIDPKVSPFDQIGSSVMVDLMPDKPLSELGPDFTRALEEAKEILRNV